MLLRNFVSANKLIQNSSESTPPQALESGTGVTATSNSGCSSSMVEWRVVVSILVSNIVLILDKCL